MLAVLQIMHINNVIRFFARIAIEINMELNILYDCLYDTYVPTLISRGLLDGFKYLLKINYCFHCHVG